MEVLIPVMDIVDQNQFLKLLIISTSFKGIAPHIQDISEISRVPKDVRNFMNIDPIGILIVVVDNIGAHCGGHITCSFNSRVLEVPCSIGGRADFRKWFSRSRRLCRDSHGAKTNRAPTQK